MGDSGRRWVEGWASPSAVAKSYERAVLRADRAARPLTSRARVELVASDPVTRAIVLVGGFGTRLRPLTNSTPKQMLPIVNRPMIEHVLEHLAAHGVTEAILSLGFRPDAFQEAYPGSRHGPVRLAYAVEPEPLDTAGAIRYAARCAGSTSGSIVCNGDVLTDLDITDLLERHEAAGATATIALHRVADPSAFGVVAPTATDVSSRIRREAGGRHRAPRTRSTPAPTCWNRRRSNAFPRIARFRSSARRFPGWSTTACCMRGPGHLLDRHRHPGDLSAGAARPVRRTPRRPGRRGAP